MPTVARGVYRWIFLRGATLEDFADRLNHFWTFGILLVFAAILSWKQVIQDPMLCWVPAHFTDALSKFTHSHCWNSHYIQYMDDLVDAQDKLNISSMSQYPFSRFDIVIPSVTFKLPAEPSLLVLYSTTTTLYQWIPLILVFQALLFKLPNVLMYLCHGYLGLSFDKLNGLTQGYANLNIAERSALTKQISRYIYNWCNQIWNVLPWRFVTIAWFLTKLLFLINIVMQMFYLDKYIRTTNAPFDNSTSYGDVIIDNFFTNNGSEWKQSPMFPRQVLCEFDIRQLTNIHSYTVTCDLPINEYSEVAFIFLWIWFLVVAIVTALSLITWMILIVVPLFRQRYIIKMLHISEEFSDLTTNEASKFADWVGEDGVMALKLIGSNSSDLIVSDVTCHMWKRRKLETGTSMPAHGYIPPEQAFQGQGPTIQQAPPIQHGPPVQHGHQIQQGSPIQQGHPIQQAPPIQHDQVIQQATPIQHDQATQQAPSMQHNQAIQQAPLIQHNQAIQQAPSMHHDSLVKQAPPMQQAPPVQQAQPVYSSAIEEKKLE